MLAKERLPNVDCRIFMMDERAFNKEFNAYFKQSKEKFGVEYVRCRISGVKEDPDTHDLILRYVQPDGQFADERFSMVVLSVGTQPPEQAKTTAASLGIDLNPYGFCETDKFTPLQTSQPGVYVCGAFQSPKEIAETIIDAAGAAGDVMRLMRADLNKSGSSRKYPFISAKDNGFVPERDVSGEPIRVGVYVCDCHPSIDGVVDTAALVRAAAALPDVVRAARIGYGCFDEGAAANSTRYCAARAESSGGSRVQPPHARVRFFSGRSGRPASTRTCWRWSTFASIAPGSTAPIPRQPLAKRWSWCGGESTGCA